MKSYGRAPTFLLTTGYEQVRSIVAALAGDRAAAERVELELLETGVCSSDRGRQAESEAEVAEALVLQEETPVACSAVSCGSTPQSTHS